ncbi:aldehyde dehydrogenase (NADP(+)) [Streptomyces sp. NPDC005496]|uniref:aldehyde dehydrogenase (NADP(+)) n=1 Tax=unclassified Streptomyces TaxID=2593676 RepID=UPI0033B0284B
MTSQPLVPSQRAHADSPDGVDRAAAAAESAAPDLAALGLPERARLLHGLADALAAQAGKLVAVAQQETGLSHARLTTEVLRTQVQLRMFADIAEEGAYLDVMIDLPDPAALPAPRPDLRRMLVPLGPVAVFSASNFPFAFSVLGGDTASALTAGCPVVVKAHEGHPQLSSLTAELAAEVLPPGALSVVHGREAGRRLVQDHRIRAAGFTGSTAGGRALFDLACARPDPIPFYGELGSLNPVVVTPAALAERGPELAREYIASVTFSQGQLCTKPGLLFLPEGHGLTEVLTSEAQAVPAAPMLGQWIHDGYLASVDEVGRHSAVRILMPLAPRADDQTLVTPTLLSVHAGDLRAAPELLRECFGPASLIVEYGTEEELFHALALVPGSLTVTVQGREGHDDLLARRVMSSVPAGRVLWNNWPTGVAVSPAMQHGGPWPATTSPLHTSVGGTAVARWLRPVVYQNLPDVLLPPALQHANPLDIPRRQTPRT